MKKTVTVEVGDTAIVISKLPLGKYAQLLRAVKEVPKMLGLIDGSSNEQIVQKLPELIATSLPDIIEILTIATPLTKEVMNSADFGLDDAVNVISAVIEVNNYKGVFDSVKKMTASQPAKTE